MQQRLSDILSNKIFTRDEDGIYTAPMRVGSVDQEMEKKLREAVAEQEYENYLAAVSSSHSIPVMDHEVDRFLANMPTGALILDVGGCWGWHWRRVAETRPDIGILIIDFVKANLNHAKKILGPLLETQVSLMHADATSLPFPDAVLSGQGFDGVWTVQVYQHIPDFALACREAYRVLKPGGRFATYSLNRTPFNRFVFRLFNKHFHTDGMVNNQYYLVRANDEQRDIVKQVFGDVVDRYTECLFHPDLKLSFSGRPGSIAGKLDILLGVVPWIGRWFARQRSFESIKK